MMSKIFIHITLLFGAICFSQSSFSVLAQSDLSLQQALAIALQNNFNIKVADQSLQIARNEDSWARAGKGPLITLGANLPQTFTNNDNPVSFINGLLYNTNLTLDANLQMPLYTGGRIEAIKANQELNTELALINRKAEIINTNRAVALAYFDAVLIQERITLLQSVISLSKERLAYEDVKEEFGRSNSFERRQLLDALFADSTNIIQQKLNFDNAIRSLKLAMNDNTKNVYTLTDSLPDVATIIDYEDAKSRLNNGNVTLKTLLVNKELAQNNIGIQESVLKPSINLNSGLTFQENFAKLFSDNPQTGEPIPARFGNVASANLGLSASYLLYDGSVSRNNIQNAKIRAEIADLNYQNVLINLNVQLQNLLENHKAQLQVIQLIDQQIANAQTNILQAEERLKIGQINSLDYRAIQLQYLNASLSKVNATYSLAQLAVEIEALLSTGE